MSRFEPRQADLFRPSQPDLPLDEPDPMIELTALLDRLRAADTIPWPTVSAAMQAELRVLYLAKEAGPEGERCAQAIFAETERLFRAEDEVVSGAALS